MSSTHAPNTKRHKKRTYLKVAAFHVMERNSEANTNDRRTTHHGEDTKSEGSTQALVTPITLYVNTHNGKVHRHCTTAITSKPQYGDVNEIPTPSPSKRRNDGSPSRTRLGKRQVPHPLEQCSVTASEQSYTRAVLWLYRTLDP